MIRKIYLHVCIIIVFPFVTLACDPTEGDPWYNEEVKIEELPVGLGLQGNRLFLKQGAKRCSIKGETPARIDSAGINALSVCNYDSKQVREDGRPEEVNVPEPIECEFEVVCNPLKYEVDFLVSYKVGKGTIGQEHSSLFYRHLRVNEATLPEGITVTTAGGSDETGWLYRFMVKDGVFCTTSYLDTENDLRSIPYISELLFEQIEESYPGRWTGKNPPKPFQRKQEVLCYQSQFSISGKVKYALNENYRRDAHKVSAKECVRVKP